MSAEPSQTTIANAWSRWQNQVVQGRFVLRRCLGWSDQGAVFLTEHKAKNLAEAAIKFVRADAPQAQPLLVRWQAAVNLSHPHLVQLFEVGRWQVEGQDYLFVVMEYGDQTLAEILRRRPLSAEEVEELLPPVLDALTFLHRRQLVHSQLKPSNFLAVGDQLKLASDTIRPAGLDHGSSTAGDVWSLGATLGEAITARARLSIDQFFDEGSLPAGLPGSLVETVRRCLSPLPDERPSIIELRAEYKLAPAPAPASKPEPQVQKVSQVTAPVPPANAVSRVASLTESIPMVPNEVPPLQPIQTASRVTVSFHAIPSTSPAAVQAQPASSASPATPPARATAPVLPANVASRVAVSSHLAPSAPPEATSPRPASTASQTAASFQSAASAPREIASPPPANTASYPAATTQSVPSAPRDVAPAQPANIGARATASSQSVSSAQRDVTPPQAANSASRLTASAQPVPSDPREVAQTQAGNIAPRVAALGQPELSAQRDVTPPQAANGASRAVPSASPVSSAPREVAQTQAGNIAPRVAAPAQPGSSTPREVTPPQAANIALRVAPPVQPVPSAPREIAPPAAANIAPRVATPAQAVPSTPRVVAQPRPVTSSSQEAAPAENAPKRHILGIAAGALLLAIAVWIGLRSTNDSPAPLQPAVIPAPVTPPAPEKVADAEPTLLVPVSPPPEQPAPPAATSSVLKDVLPTVPEKIRSKIQGRIYVTVRVLVDPAGNVMGVLMENAGPSKYFARISDQAAREWQFVPSDTDTDRVWLLEFEYTRDGAAVRTLEQ